MNIKTITNRTIFLVALLFVSQMAVGQNKTNSLAEALENGTHNQVASLIKEGAELDNSEEYLHYATLNSNIKYVKQNYSLLLKNGYKPAKHEYLSAFYSAIDQNNTEVMSFLATQPEWNFKNDFKNNQAEIFQRAYT